MAIEEEEGEDTITVAITGEGMVIIKVEDMARAVINGIRDITTAGEEAIIDEKCTEMQ